MLSPTLTVLGVLFFGGVGLCKLYEDVADLPRLEYDYVVVGGGTAGNVVANRLTENPDVSVLVLEAGVSNEGVLVSEVPFLGIDLLAPTGPYSWNYTTTPQKGLNGRAISYARAYLLGGCSSHNDMVYTRGAQDDFDRYAKLTGDEGWSWNQIFPYFLKNEKWTPPADQHDTRGQFNPGIHGTAGPISVSLSGFQWPDFQRRIIQTTEELPDDFPFNLDMNSGQPLGVGWVQSTIGHGERSSSATGYLAPDFIQRPNLDVLLHAHVSKLVNVTQHQGKPSFGGVQFRSGASLFVAEASKEIILSAGSIGTPQILLNSGVGDHNTLHALGIPTVLDLPSVGQNASDHTYFGLTWAVNSNDTIESITQNATRFNAASEQWNTSRTGPFVFAQAGTHAGWLRLSQNSPVFDIHPDPSPGPGAPHFELLRPTPSVVSLFILLPVSRIHFSQGGSVTISSGDPFANPLINPGYLASEFDAIALREGVKLAQKFFSASAWHGYLGAPTINLAAMNATEQMATLRANVDMSPRDATYGVVNPDLTVKGIAGLRVIDASVLPIVPGAHTQAATYVVAERGADLVKQLWT
ncbi:aryl-alcohol oxidase-like protein [Mycena rosella]|uniref:Aryl-alcohol oxidase-like protein n=1 Tax=Mycena rosella TaxID=1033263 RepID=A0AAD7C6A8_MYCRO|nr:aryl-alcohol oxidase-like protein [Mycena rosella]